MKRALLICAGLVIGLLMLGTAAFGGVRPFEFVILWWMIIAVIVLFVHYWQLAFVALLVGLAAFLVYQRLRELRP